MQDLSPLQKMRLQFHPKLPKMLADITRLTAIPKAGKVKIDPQIAELLPDLKGPDFLSFAQGQPVKHSAKRVGVVLSGGQAAGGHNVITGLFDALKKLHPESRLFGFLEGPKGIVENKYIELTAELLASYRNQGGFDLIGSGRTKIETPEQFEGAEAAARTLNLDGLVIIGGDDSNTNAALLAEYYLKKGCKTTVVGVPKTIDGDLKNEDVEISFGFDTATKTYSETIGSIMRDTLSAKKSYYFIKLMGRSASHIALECALQTHPNMALIGEEVAAQNKTLSQLTLEIADLICKRAEKDKDYGVILIPEGIIEFIPEFLQLINEINILLAADKPHLKQIESMSSKEDQIDYITKKLTAPSASCFQSIPLEIQSQLLLDRDPHGNVQVSKIETERLFIETVKKELSKRKKSGTYKGKFSAQPHFCGYEGRSCLPSNFDAQYCYALGYTAAILLETDSNGYICCVQDLTRPVEDWQIAARSLKSMLIMHSKSLGKKKPIIGKAFVDLKGKPFTLFAKHRSEWALNDDYCNPGPIQFYGPTSLTDSITLTLALERENVQIN